MKSIKLAKNEADALQEVEILKDLQHPNIVSCVGHFIGSGFPTVTAGGEGDENQEEQRHRLKKRRGSDASQFD